MSDTPARASGFGLVTAEVCRRLVRLGHDIVILGWWSSGTRPDLGLEVKPCPVSPAGATATIAAAVAEFKPQYLITHGDIPWLSYVAGDEVQKVLAVNATRWCLYYPVDGTLPDGSLPKEWSGILACADLRVTMSEFAVAASGRSGIDATFIPHGCDTALFRPPPCKDDAKRRFGYQDRFVVLSDARNHRRKLIPRALDIIRRLRIPADRLVFHLHTGARGQEDAESYRYDVRADLELLGLSSARGVYDDTGDGDLSLGDLASLYAAADVHLLTSFGEGFGLPTLQAASSGVVPIVAANSASIELVGQHGFAVPCDSWTTDEFGLVRGFIDRRRAALVVQSLYENADLLDARAAAARRYALGFSWDRVAAQWDTLLRTDQQKAMVPRPRTSERIPKVFSDRRDPHGRVRSRARGLRPTGHDPSVLPIPRLAVPTRLKPPCDDSSMSSRPSVLVEKSWLPGLRRLERLFPGTRVVPIPEPSSRTDGALLELIGGATLVVDPRGRIPRLDLLCALDGVSFLGRSPLWMPVPGQSLVLRARHLLTDHPRAEERATVAMQRARASG